jgi:hypothetical protein
MCTVQKQENLLTQITETVLSAPIVALGWIAQLEEHRPYKARVGGSSPSPPTKVLQRTAWSGSSVG